jgi:hypothetical protein
MPRTLLQRAGDEGRPLPAKHVQPARVLRRHKPRPGSPWRPRPFILCRVVGGGAGAGVECAPGEALRVEGEEHVGHPCVPMRGGPRVSKDSLRRRRVGRYGRESLYV